LRSSATDALDPSSTLRNPSVGLESVEQEEDFSQVQLGCNNDVFNRHGMPRKRIEHQFRRSERSWSLLGGNTAPLRFSTQRKKHIATVSGGPATIEEQLVCAR